MAFSSVDQSLKLEQNGTTALLEQNGTTALGEGTAGHPTETCYEAMKLWLSYVNFASVS